MSWNEYQAMLWALWGVLAAIAVVGGWIGVRALHAYRDRRATPLLLLAGGVLVLSVGMPLVWVTMYLGTHDILECSLASMIGLLAGLGLVVASVEAHGP